MSLADPQTITIDSVPYTLNRVETGETKSVYRTSDGDYQLTVSHQETKAGRTRRMARLDCRVVAADPLTSENEYKSLGLYQVLDEPEYGFDDADIVDIVAGFQTWCDGTMVGKICGSQH